jgi:hypothetical protein
MKLIVLYRPNSEHASVAEAYMRDFARAHPERKVEALNIDTREGAEKAEVYDIVQYPALLAVKDDGAIVKFWQGEPLPLMNEVAGYS